MRQNQRKPVLEQLRHRIVPTTSGFELQTHWGYVLGTFTSFDEAQSYYVRHCPEV